MDKVRELKSKVEELRQRMNLAAKKSEIQKLDSVMTQPDFWQDQKRAAELSKKVADLKQEVKTWESLADDAGLLLTLSQEDENDQSVNLSQEIENQLKTLTEKFERLELLTVFNDRYDDGNAILSIYAGAGGVDAQDWAEMLLRMYLRYFEKRNWRANIIDQSKGTEAGIKSVTVEVKGNYAYGYLKAESGVHRLVRLSPYDADHARHTSFAMVEVVPEVEPTAELQFKDSELKVEVFRSSGHGGQSVNTTDSAVRITHLPTRLKASCQNERSQHQNKEMALRCLKGKLVKYNESKLEAERLVLRGELTEAAWGNQIRSYVLHPYQMVKDHRTAYQVSEPQKVLDGELDDLISAYLKSLIK